MHKYFAKTLFIGKMIEYLPECHSTNEEITNRAKNKTLKEGMLLMTDYQVAGKGQRGSAWVSERARNLLFSLLLKPSFLRPDQVYLLNVITSLAVISTLRQVANGPKYEIKWPNDVYANDLKICGILIETSVGNKDIDQAVVGVGININQKYFHLNSATSLAIELNGQYDRMDILEKFAIHLEHLYLKLKSGRYPVLTEQYINTMRWRGENHTFRSGTAEFVGEIIGINPFGRLLVNVNNQERSFDVKEIEFRY